MAKKTNIEINGSKYFRVTRTIGHKSDGTPIRKQFYGTGINEANEKADKYINNLKIGLINDGKLLTINVLLPKWLFSVKKNEIKPTSFESYESTYRNYIKDYLIADLPINELKSLKIQEFYNTLIKNKKSVYNVKKAHKLLRQFFGYCEKEGYIVKNPCINISLPKEKNYTTKDILTQKQKFKYFNEDEIQKLKNVFKGNKYEDVVWFALGTGMREGEILGLQWDDIDLEKKEIHILHSLNRSAEISEDGTRKYITKLGPPKTPSSIRTIPISNTIYNILKRTPKSKDFVFKLDDKYLDAKDLQKIWKKTLIKNNIEYRKFHDLRHTFATMLLTHGANLITVKELLGHASLKITEIYLDALPKTKREFVEKIDLIIN